MNLIMDYFLPKLRQELAGQARTVLNSDEVVVEDAGDKFDAQLAIPVFTHAAKQSVSPPELAAKLAGAISHPAVAKAEPAGGFVNIWLKSGELGQVVVSQAASDSYGQHDSLKDKEIVIEHTDPNPFKELHIGHLYSNTVGESIARLHEAAGAKVHRVSYHGDVGLHVAKAVWAMGKSISWQNERFDELESAASKLGDFYAKGAAAYDSDESAKAAITEINKQIYSQSDDMINQIYQWGKAASFAYFNSIFEILDVGFDHSPYLESQAGPAGIDLVKTHMDKFEESQGAVVFRDGDEHTRVFITSQGLPTYESKELGLAKLKDGDFPDASKSIIITANEINAYFRVVLKVLRLIEPKLADKTRHLSHGLVKLPSGKMSSRTGDVVLATDLLSEVESAVKNRSPDSPSVKDNSLAAIKYAFLKPNVGGDIVYDVEESINLEGQTGPYVQYAAVRLQSILAKVKDDNNAKGYGFEAEKNLLMLIARYPEVTAKSISELAPHRIAQYVYELAREFNRYYEKVPVKDAEVSVRPARLAVLKSGLGVLKHGLGLLNIPVPDKM